MILPVVLIFLVVGALIITPSLSFASTGLRAALASKERIDQLYAAGAGVEDAIHKIKYNDAIIPKKVGDKVSYVISDVNGKVMGMEVEHISDIPNDRTYLIESKASGISSSTIVKSYISNIPNLFNYAAVSKGEIKTQPKAEIIGLKVPFYTGWWPTSEMLRLFYKAQVVPPYPISYPDNKIDVALMPEIGPMYRVGNLDILGKGDVKLVGTVYVTSEDGKPQTGKLNIDKPVILDLGGQTIFVDSNPDGDAINIGVDVVLKGSGAIIAVGDIKFMPKLESSHGDYIFLMSVEGEVVLQPMGNFYGTVAGSVSIRLQPEFTIKWNPPPPGGINFPNVPGDNRWIVRTWEISR